MFLTRFQLNPSRQGSRRLLASQQRMHAAVLAGFPAADGSQRVLWRVDAEPHRTDLFIVSGDRPDLSHLVEQAGWPTTATWETRDYRPLLERLEEGQRWAFRLTANPSRSVPTGSAQRGTVKAHVTPGQQEQWLLDRAHRLGFGVPTSPHGNHEIVTRNRRTARFRRRSADGALNDVTVAMVTYDGVLEVENADDLRTALTQGIGRAKAYGCGLLTLARP